jgi:hypothetical protein
VSGTGRENRSIFQNDIATERALENVDLALNDQERFFVIRHRQSEPGLAVGHAAVGRLSKLLSIDSADRFGQDHTTRAVLTAGGRG